MSVCVCGWFLDFGNQKIKKRKAPVLISYLQKYIESKHQLLTVSKNVTETEMAEAISRAASLKRHVRFVHWLSPANSDIIWYHRSVYLPFSQQLKNILRCISYALSNCLLWACGWGLITVTTKTPKHTLCCVFYWKYTIMNFNWWRKIWYLNLLSKMWIYENKPLGWEESIGTYMLTRFLTCIPLWVK